MERLHQSHKLDHGVPLECGDHSQRHPADGGSDLQFSWSNQFTEILPFGSVAPALRRHLDIITKRVQAVFSGCRLRPLNGPDVKDRVWLRVCKGAIISSM